MIIERILKNKFYKTDRVQSGVIIDYVHNSVSMSHINLLTALSVLRGVAGYTPNNDHEHLFWSVINTLEFYGPHSLQNVCGAYLRSGASIDRIEKIKDMVHTCWCIEAGIEIYDRDITPIVVRYIGDILKIFNYNIDLINKGIAFMMQDQIANELSLISTFKLKGLTFAIKRLNDDKNIPKLIFALPQQNGGGNIDVLIALWRGRIMLANSRTAIRLNCLEVLKSITEDAKGYASSANFPINIEADIHDLLQVSKQIIEKFLNYN